MEMLFPRLLSASRVNGAVLRRSEWKCQRCRSLSTTNLLRAKSSKATPKKTQPIKVQPTLPKPLEYKYKPIPGRHAPPPPPPAKPNPLKHRSVPIVLGGLTLLIFSAYSGYLYVYLSRDPPHPVESSPSAQPDVSSRYNSIASKFDSEVDFNEALMRLPSLRRKLVSQAHGDVLEVSIGTGRNLEYYDWDFKGHNGVGKVARTGGIKRGKIRSFTAIDKSGEMLEVAHEKFSEMFPGILGVRWVIGDAEGEIPSPPKNANERSGTIAGGKYDTVVQTMGLCSVRDPVGMLRNLGGVIKENEGRILLLEHGRGSWEWLNGVLDRFAERHAREFGCWWNRDLDAIVRESGLEVVEMRTIWWHGGTTWWIELKRPKGTLEENAAAADVVKERDRVEAPGGKRWW